MLYVPCLHERNREANEFRETNIILFIIIIVLLFTFLFNTIQISTRLI